MIDLFEDPFVFDLPLPEWIRKPLGRWIAKRRAPKIAKIYESMGFGGGSPLVSETNKQAVAIAQTLKKITGKTWESSVTMTCGHPNIRDMSAEFLIPSKKILYFHYIPIFPDPPF